MRILALCSLSDAPGWRKDNTTSPVDQWRIVRPYMNLKKAGWHVDFDKVIIPNFSKKMEITDDTYKQVYERVKQYDMIVSSYFTSASMFTLIMVVCEKLAIPFVMDVDDDWFDIPADNPVWNKITQTDWVNIQIMLEDVPFVTTTNEYLAQKLVDHRKNKDPRSVLVIPNMISTEEYDHPEYDNGDKVVIGWVGGSSHYKDLHETGMLEALANVMHRHKNVEFHCMGMPIDKYLPKARVKELEGARGLVWLDKWKDLKFDIGLAPLTGREFDQSKSDIKWQEYSLMGAAFVGTNTGPYRRSVKNNFTGLLVENTVESWEQAIEKLIADKGYRKSIATAARSTVEEISIEKNVEKLKERLKLICVLALELPPSSDRTTSETA